MVLSPTGAPVPFAKRFVLDMTVPCVGWVEYCLAGPDRGADYVAEILGPDAGPLPASTSAATFAKGRREPALVGMDRSYMLIWGLPSAGYGRPVFGKCSVTVGEDNGLNIAPSSPIITLSIIDFGQIVGT